MREVKFITFSMLIATASFAQTTTQKAEKLQAQRAQQNLDKRNAAEKGAASSSSTIQQIHEQQAKKEAEQQRWDDMKKKSSQKSGRASKQ